MHARASRFISGNRVRIALFLLFIFGIQSTALAAEPSPRFSSSSSIGVALFRMIGSLALVIALFFAVVWFFRNVHRFKPAGMPNRKLQILEARTLGVKQTIYVVGYEQQRLLVGATAQGITLLAHLPDGTAEPESERIVPVSFGEALLQALGRK